MDPDEYESTKKETLEQLDEFRKSLSKMESGDLTLVDTISRVQLAIRAAVSQAFSTPEVIRLFAKKAPGDLRERLTALQRDHQLGRLPKSEYNAQATEVLAALQKLGQELTPEETAFLEANMTASMREFENVSGEDLAGKGVISAAKSQIQSAQQRK